MPSIPEGYYVTTKKPKPEDTPQDIAYFAPIFITNDDITRNKGSGERRHLIKAKCDNARVTMEHLFIEKGLI
ncbi:hypothetical protein [Glutamicibacter sp.]|jgi:hypothetical protein|uniref:hypothetical protein n=1 Tax=Glutamicibacter sp. TaxID=1931995 RepID=UPI002FD9BE44